MNDITFRISPEIANIELNDLFTSAWEGHIETNFSYLKNQSLGFICAYVGNFLIGFINIPWDGNRHAFILDTTVRKEYQKKGIGKELVRQALILCKNKKVEWVHVDFEPEYEHFYRSCGFVFSPAGILNLYKATHIL